MPARLARVGDRHAAMDDHPCALDGLLELSARQEREGLGDAPWPPHYRKQAGEAPRVTPSKRRTPVHPLVEIARSPGQGSGVGGRRTLAIAPPRSGGAPSAKIGRASCGKE